MIHIIKNKIDPHPFAVWTDCDDSPGDGRVIGLGETVPEALADAHAELKTDLDLIGALQTRANAGLDVTITEEP
jgi:hypothetical protein